MLAGRCGKKSYLGRLDESRRRRLRRRLLGWYDRERRDLPWRRTRDPYAIWVAEVMLQQTQVATALPYWTRFLKRFPTVSALAGASDEAVLKAWQGLGYYRRALNLHRAANEVVRAHGGRVPEEASSLESLPGVGRYTSGAVGSIAFGRRVAALDGNAARVLARWLAVREPVSGGRTRGALWEVAESLVPEGRPGDWNQAVMELGSEVCLPRGPRCKECPVKGDCAASSRGLTGKIPARVGRRRIPHIEVGAGIVWRRGRVLLCRRPAEAMLGGLWEFPGGKVRAGESVSACIRRELEEECGLAVEVGEHLVDVTHTYSHLRVTLRCYHCRAPRGRVRRIGCTDARWVRPAEIGAFALPAADVRILEALGVDRARARRAARGTG